MKNLFRVLFTVLLLASCSNDEAAPIPPGDGGGAVIPPPDTPPDPVEQDIEGFTPCDNGMAGTYPCEGFDLLGRLGLQTLQANSGNDIWGWTDPDTGKEYALVGLDNGTAFVDITDTDALRYLGKLPTATVNSPWRDIKVYQNHAYIVSEAQGHGMQVFDLTRLRSVTNTPDSFAADARYTGFGNAHNIVINENSGFAYAVGTARNDLYNGGVHFLDISDPGNPQAAGGYGASGYTHDAQVVTYAGPDAAYTGREILIGANESQVVVVDITDKGSPVLITNIQYSNTGYTHQGWFTDDQQYFILGDETDEIAFGFDSRTLVFDVADLDNPVPHMTYTGPTPAIDHNGYVHGGSFYLANYTAGMRRIDLTQIAGQVLTEAAYFDTYPANNTPSFDGVWSVYPYFSSGKVVLGDINSGLFVVESDVAP